MSKNRRRLALSSGPGRYISIISQQSAYCCLLLSIREVETDSPRKRRKVEEGSRDKPTLEDWEKFEKAVLAFEVQHINSQNKFVFDFVQGPLINALRAGHW